MLPGRPRGTFGLNYFLSPAISVDLEGVVSAIPRSIGWSSMVEALQSVDFNAVFRAELAAIRERHNKPGRSEIGENVSESVPSTTLGLTGITCSGGGIRSASFCLGVLQGLQSRDTLDRMDYLSTVSGGGYIGTTLTIGMSNEKIDGKLHEGAFPFGRLEENRETPEVRHIRDNSRYLVPKGLPSVVTALAIYLRGIMMNILVILPVLFCAAAVLVWLNPDTRELTLNRFLWLDLTGWFGGSRLPFTILTALILIGLLIVYAVAVSVLPIKPIAERQKAAMIAGVIFGLAFFVVLLEVHATLLRLVFEARGYIKPPEQAGAASGGDLLRFVFDHIKSFVIYVTPVVVVVLPFLKQLISKATTAESSSWGGFARKLLSRIVLLVAASFVPILLWLVLMQLAYWGTGIPQCPATGAVLSCARDATAASVWPRAPAPLQWLFGNTAYYHGAFLSFVIAAGALFCFWPFLSVNSNSLHQLYRDRLGAAFLIRRKLTKPTDDEVISSDNFKLSQIDPKHAPYHLINTALNVPGSTFANRRGRNADFFLFSQGHIGSEATGYVDTKSAEQVVDGLNIGTAMAISGAAAAPNMGMASIRPLSPTIAFLNVRLGRWVRHPQDIAERAAALRERAAKAKAANEAAGKTTTADDEAADKKAGESQLRRIPGPRYLLNEAFSKTGVSVTHLDAKTIRKQRGFVFLTDGGHIDNLGIYELLRRRCKLIIVIDGEADPDYDSGSLVQIERFARIDLNVIIRMNWEAIGVRTREVSEEIKNNDLKIEAGPHVALGSISYPPLTAGGEREIGAMIYVKASMSGDELDYVTAYKRANPQFPNETTLEQLFSEEQLEAYRALGEHIALRFLDGRDHVAVYDDQRDDLLKILREMLPAAATS
jgi:hypothetical protein